MHNKDEKRSFGLRLRSAFELITRGSLAESGTPFTGTSFSAFGSVNESGVAVNEESALTFSAVYACVRLLSELPASLPIDIYEEKNGTRTPVTNHPLVYLLNKPNSFQNGFTFNEYSNSLMQLWGNSICIIKREAGIPVEIIPVHTKGVTPLMSDGKLYFRINDIDLGISGTFFSEEVLHFKMLTKNGIWGYDPISLARESIGVGLAAERFGAKFFGKKGKLRAVVLTDKIVDEKNGKAISDKISRQKDHDTLLLDDGMKYQPIDMPLNNAQFLESRIFQLQEVCRWFNIPPHLVAELSRSTFSNIEHSDLQFLKYTLRSILRRREAELESKLLNPKEIGTIKIRHNIDNLLRGDLATLTAHIRDMVTVGVMTRNEGRSLINRNPIEGLDVPLNPANITGKQNTQNNAN